MCFLDCFVHVKIQQNMRMTSRCAQVWENINHKAYGIRIINTPGNLKSAECSWSLCQL